MRLGQFRYSADAIILAIQSWVQEYGHVPTENDWYASDARPTVPIIQKRFGRWNVALETAGYPSRPKR